MLSYKLDFSSSVIMADVGKSSHILPEIDHLTNLMYNVTHLAIAR